MPPSTNKVALVTGSANGLGKALATELYRQGFDLALIDIDKTGLEQLQSGLQTGSRRQLVTIHVADISQEEEIIRARKDIFQLHQQLDILINNAGVSISQPFDQVALKDYKRLFDINFWGAIYCTRHFLGDLRQQPDSHLVNIISGFALMGFPGKTAYGASKSAIMGFTNALRTELSDTSIKISLVIPPPLDTDIVMNGLHINEIKRHKEAEFLRKKGMPPDKAAKKILAKMQAGKYRIVIGPMMFWIDLSSRLFPTLLHRIIGRNKAKIDFV